MRLMLASVAAIALVAGPVAAQNGKGNGNGNARGGPPAQAQQDRGNGGGNGAGNANRGNMRPDRGPDVSQARGNSQGNRNAQAQRHDNGPPAVRGNGNANGNASRAAANGNGNPRIASPGRGNSNGNRNGNGNRDNGRFYDAPLRYLADGFDRNAGNRRTGLINGCPPGLARKYNGCRPPGQVRKSGWLRHDRYDSGWWGLPRLLGDGYRYDSGFLLRIGRDGSVGGYIPLLGGALAIGNTWPNNYGYDRLSPYYSDYYSLGRGSYRYADNVVYRLDPETAAITSVAALLTGDDFVVGQPVPRGYDIYNVPPSYRDRYYDRPGAHYRYSDGYIYQVDPETRLVAAAIELLVS